MRVWQSPGSHGKRPDRTQESVDTETVSVRKLMSSSFSWGVRGEELTEPPGVFVARGRKRPGSFPQGLAALKSMTQISLEREYLPLPKLVHSIFGSDGVSMHVVSRQVLLLDLDIKAKGRQLVARMRLVPCKTLRRCTTGEAYSPIRAFCLLSLHIWLYGI